MAVVRRADLSKEQRAVLDRILLAWTVADPPTWPVYQWLEREIERDYGFDPASVLRSLPAHLIQLDRYRDPNPDDRLTLTVAGIACCEGLPRNAYLSLFLRTLAWCIHHYDVGVSLATPHHAERISVTSDLAREQWRASGADDSPLIVARAGAMLHTEQGIWDQFGSNDSEPPQWTAVLAPRIKRYRNVADIDDYLARSDPGGDLATPTAPDVAGPVSSPFDTGEYARSWDVFISHASEDKLPFVADLAAALKEAQLRVWYDAFTLTVGDSLRKSIDHGLAQSRYGVVVLSHNFFAKGWPQAELDGLYAREVAGKKIILPVWHGLSASEVRNYSPLLADLVASDSSHGIERVVNELIKAMV